MLREPIVAGLPVGLFFAWRFRLRAAILPLVVVAVMVAVFMIGPFFGLPLIGRYVRTPSVLLALFYGLAVAGWLLLDPGRRRQLWMWIGIAVGALSLLFLPWHVGMVADTRRNLDQRARAYESLRDVAEAGRAPAPRRRRLRRDGERRGAPHPPPPALVDGPPAGRGDHRRGGREPARSP